MTKIYYVRHGETVDNKKSLLTGNVDVSLSKVGKEQAKETSLKLKDIKFDIIFCSPLKRAIQTVNEINKFHKLPINIDNRIIERDWGIFTKKHTSSLDREVAWNYYLDVTQYENKIELVRSVFERVNNFINELKTKYKNKTILVVAHSGVARAFDCYFNGIPKDGALLNKKLNNADILEFVLK